MYVCIYVLCVCVCVCVCMYVCMYKNTFQSTLKLDMRKINTTWELLYLQRKYLNISRKING